MKNHLCLIPKPVCSASTEQRNLLAKEVIQLTFEKSQTNIHVREGEVYDAVEELQVFVKTLK